MKNLRKNFFINKIVRSFIKGIGAILPTPVRSALIRKWRVSGVIEAEIIKGVSIKYFLLCDDNMADHLYYDPEGYAEIYELRFFAALAKKSNVILDVGANTGLYSIVASKANPSSKIFAFEPYPANAQRLLKNSSINSVNNIELIQKAIGSTDGEIEFTVPENDQVCDVLSADQKFTEKFYRKWITYKQVTVGQKSLDSFIKEKNIQKVDLVKIDVENYELEALRGAKQFLQNQSPIVLCEIFVDEERIKFYDEFLKPMGYTCYMILKSGLEKSEKLSMNSGCTNFLFTKKRINDQSLSFNDMEKIADLFI